MSLEKIKKLREETGLGIIECKKAFEEAGYDEKKAREILKKRSLESAVKREHRETKSGIIEAYSHRGKIGVLVELLCETDFVAKNAEFRNLAHNLALQIASMAPQDEKELLEQPYIKDESQTVSQLIQSVIAKTGENIKLRRFIRYEI
jgi:elongation factor Ts